MSALATGKVHSYRNKW